MAGIRHLVRALPLVALVALGACSDDPAGPSGDPFDPEQTSGEFATLGDAFLANQDVAQDLAFVAEVFADFSTSAWTLDVGAEIVESPLVEPVGAGSLRSLVGGSAQPILPADLLGTTFEWDAEAAEYVPTERTGAPADGVRFIVYDRTTVPPTENGHLDVVDESDASADRLSVLLVKDEVTRLDYDVSVVATTSGASLSIGGYVTDGADRIDFELDETVSETAGGLGIGVHYAVSLAGQPLSVELDFEIELGTVSSQTLAATFVNGGNTLVMDLTQTGDTDIEGSVEWNGDLVMTITGDETGEVVFLGPDGEELTPAEAQAIEEMFEIATEGLALLEAYVAFLGGSLA